LSLTAAPPAPLPSDHSLNIAGPNGFVNRHLLSHCLIISFFIPLIPPDTFGMLEITLNVETRHAASRPRFSDSPMTAPISAIAQGGAGRHASIRSS